MAIELIIIIILISLNVLLFAIVIGQRAHIRKMTSEMRHIINRVNVLVEQQEEWENIEQANNVRSTEGTK